MRYNCIICGREFERIPCDEPICDRCIRQIEDDIEDALGDTIVEDEDEVPDTP